MLQSEAQDALTAKAAPLGYLGVSIHGVGGDLVLGSLYDGSCIPFLGSLDEGSCNFGAIFGAPDCWKL